MKYILIIIAAFTIFNVSAQTPSKKNHITNLTDFQLGLPAMILMDSIHDLYNTHVVIKYLPTQYKDLYKGMCVKNDEHFYTIYINKNLDILECLEVLCHEFIHVEQYYNGYLHDCGLTVIYKGVVYKYDVDYNKRIYEVEAFKGQYRDYKVLKKIIIKVSSQYSKYLGYRY